MMNLGSEGVYLDEKCRTNPSRYLPGPKTLENDRKSKIYPDFPDFWSKMPETKGRPPYGKNPIMLRMFGK